MSSSLTATAIALVLLAVLPSCRRVEPPQLEKPASAARPAPPAARAPVIVFAASSLTDAFNDLEQRFEALHPEADVALAYGGSQVLKLQISEGAPCDVFASADEEHMRELVVAGRVEPSRIFATNELTLIVPRDNPARINALKDLPQARRLVIGAKNVPVGAYARELLSRASASYGAAFEKEVLSRVVSEEANVRLVRAKVELGEADAALVYRTDASEKVTSVVIAPELNVRARYPIARLAQAPQPELARVWIDYVLSSDGQAALAARGFSRSQ